MRKTARVYVSGIGWLTKKITRVALYLAANVLESQKANSRSIKKVHEHTETYRPVGKRLELLHKNVCENIRVPDNQGGHNALIRPAILGMQQSCANFFTVFFFCLFLRFAWGRWPFKAAWALLFLGKNAYFLIRIMWYSCHHWTRDL